MTRGAIRRDFRKYSFVPGDRTVLVFNLQAYFNKNGETEYFYVWFCSGIPFGIRRMFFWLVLYGYDLGGSVGIIVMNFILGELIGWVILTWRIESVLPHQSNQTRIQATA